MLTKEVILVVMMCALFCDASWSEHSHLKTRPITIIERDDDTTHRLLADEAPHPLRISGEYTKDSLASKNLQAIKIMFEVASKYYSKVLKVNYIDPKKTRFETGYVVSPIFGRFLIVLSGGMNACTELKAPVQKYMSNGFDQNTTDMVIFLVIEQSSKQTYIATATGCQFQRRPIYGLISFNDRQISFRPLFNLHQYIQATIHELTHVLGFDQDYYKTFYQTPTGNEKRRTSDVVRRIGTRSYIVTPKVKAFVSEYFGCYDNTTGGLLEDEGSNANKMSHWEKLVYRDQLMTPSIWFTGFKISKLTMALLSDTNFYQEVDDSLTDTLYWGSKKGCSFARGESRQLIDNCAGSEMSCDYYGLFVKTCSTDKFSNQVRVQSSVISCGNTSLTNEMQSSPRSPNYYKSIEFGWQSRCFPTNHNPGCYKAACSPDGNSITIVAGNRSGVCSRPGEKIQMAGYSIDCPRDFRVFCSVKMCPDWCNGHGVCINGSCLCMDSWKGETCSEGCPNYYNSVSGTCVDQCNSNLYSMNKTCVKSCPSYYKPNQNRECEYCKQCEIKSIKHSSRAFTALVFTMICIIFCIL